MPRLRIEHLFEGVYHLSSEKNEQLLMPFIFQVVELPWVWRMVQSKIHRSRLNPPLTPHTMDVCTAARHGAAPIQTLDTYR